MATRVTVESPSFHATSALSLNITTMKRPFAASHVIPFGAGNNESLLIAIVPVRPLTLKIWFGPGWVIAPEASKRSPVSVT